MATGFPTKANWAAGDILTAAVLDDLAGTVNLLSNASAATGSQLVSNAAGTSFAYQLTPSASNPVLNSAMQIWQRGTTSADSIGSPYTADRWQLSRSTTLGATVSRQPTGDTTNLPNIQYCSRVQRTAANASISVIYFSQSFESINSIPLAGKTVTLSFYARAGANFSSASNVLSGYLETGTGTDQNIVVVAWTGAATPITFNSTLTTTWQRFTYTGTLAATATQIGLVFDYTPVGTAGANDYFEITGVQIDVGSVALPFRTTGTSYQQELALCQRYYVQWNSYYSAVMCRQLSTTQSYADCFLPVSMRTSPTLTIGTATGATFYSGAASTATVTIAANGTAANGFGLSFTTAAIGAVGYAGDLNIGTATIGVSAEL